MKIRSRFGRTERGVCGNQWQRHVIISTAVLHAAAYTHITREIRSDSDVGFIDSDLDLRGAHLRGRSRPGLADAQVLLAPAASYR